MKRIISICTMVCICMTMFAQATDLVIDNQTPGWLSSKINYGDQQTVENLKVTGYINSVDIRFIGSLIEDRNLKGRLDLSEVRFIGGGSIENSTKVTMFADANDKVRQVRHRSRGLRAPCREAPPRCFS